ncbi:MAG: [LysW]-aminoadipate/[LysW]-glutamate kinase [Methanonatronarchaeales archaeon]|nr:[LysW]-aminoadipate/[LysW]-glutamate kinase [Methanonatronarchaeales archaeon]
MKGSLMETSADMIGITDREEKNEGDEDVLADALSYIHEFQGETFVIKITGSVLEDDETIETLVEDLSLLHENGIRIIVVHGAGDRITNEMKRAGYDIKHINGLRVTPEEAVEKAVLTPLSVLNNQLVHRINRTGEDADAVGQTGVGMYFGHKKSPELGAVGEIDEVDDDLVEAFLGDGYLPVIGAVALDSEGNLLNINSDTAAGELASKIKADKMIVVTDIKGVLVNPSDDSTLISEMNIEDCKKAVRERSVSGGMIPKLKSSIKAIERGVGSVHIIEGKEHAIIGELLTDDGTGTMISD